MVTKKIPSIFRPNDKDIRQLSRSIFRYLQQSESGFDMRMKSSCSSPGSGTIDRDGCIIVYSPETAKVIKLI